MLFRLFTAVTDGRTDTPTDSAEAGSCIEPFSYSRNNVIKPSANIRHTLTLMSSAASWNSVRGQIDKLKE